MNKKAQRINHEKLENLFSNPHGIGLVHDYSGTSTLFNRQFPESLGMDDDFTKVMANEQKQRKTSTARPPRPRFVITFKKSFTGLTCKNLTFRLEKTRKGFFMFHIL